MRLSSSGIGGVLPGDWDLDEESRRDARIGGLRAGSACSAPASASDSERARDELRECVLTSRVGLR